MKLAPALLAIFGLCLAGSVSAGPDRPNIVFILIDDLGWMDLGVQGNQAVHTPHIDKLAGEGMRFTNAYSAAPVCSPTRAAILTGQSPARLAFTNHAPDLERFIPDNPVLLPAFMHEHLAAEKLTVAERLKSAGYATAFMGKWHLSGGGDGKPEFEPTAQGFDINIGGCGFGGPPTFFDPYRIPHLPSRKKGEYLPDRLADEAISFIGDRAKDSQPFLLCLWNYTVHWPMEAPAPLLEKYANHTGPGLNDPRYGAMIEAMDAATGRVISAIDRLGLREDTLIVFTSDNGGFGGVADNRPLRDAKGDLYEGGIRVPLIIRWPGVVKSGAVQPEPVISMDFYPTLLAAAGVAIEPAEAEDLDGTNILPLLRGAENFPRRSLYFHYPNYAWTRSNRLGGAVRDGRWKLIERFDTGQLELFDLEADIEEQNDISTSKPELAEKLATNLRAWRQKVAAQMPRKP
ncbi:MAG: sulfatase [Verrucomicrobiae bacterium]|nr:sulfatase [Verrucomicrobiae bacterium]